MLYKDTIHPIFVWYLHFRIFLYNGFHRFQSPLVLVLINNFHLPDMMTYVRLDNAKNSEFLFIELKYLFGSVRVLDIGSRYIVDLFDLQVFNAFVVVYLIKTLLVPHLAC